MDSLPVVTVAMPCLDEERHIEACLRNVLAQDYPRDHLEILVADGGSRDGTRAAVARIATEDPRVVLLDNPGRLQAAGMNEAIRRSRGDVIVRMDVHAQYAPDYVRRSVEVLQRTGADNAGGAARARGTTPFQRAVCAALESPLGVGGSSYRCAGNEGFVETVFNGAFPRRVFEEVGLYDPLAITNEDAELNQRIHLAGGRVFLSRGIVAYYFPRASPAALARQYFRYGRGRVRTLLKHGRLRSVRPVIPFLAVLTGVALLATSMLQPFTPLAFAAYLVLAGAEAVRVGRKLGWEGMATVWGLFPLLHTAHAAGFAAGLAYYLRHRDWDAPPERIPPRQQTAAPQAQGVG